MQQQPAIIATGDFPYFAPTGQPYTIPANGTVSNNAKPGATDPIWQTFSLGTVRKPVMPKYEGKAVEIKSPVPGTGFIVTRKIVRPERGLTLEIETNELSRLAMAAFYKANLIMLTDTSFAPLSGTGSIEGWLKVQRYDAGNGVYDIGDWYVDMDCSDLKIEDGNIVCPNFKFTLLQSGIAAAHAI